MKEYLYQIEDDESDESEVFIGWIRRHGKELIRCKDCKHCLNYCRIIEDRKYDYACALKEEYWYPYGRFRVNENDFCSRAERKEE